MENEDGLYFFVWGKEEEQINRVTERGGEGRGERSRGLPSERHEAFATTHCEKGASSPISPHLHPFCLQRRFSFSACPPSTQEGWKHKFI